MDTPQEHLQVRSSTPDSGNKKARRTVAFYPNMNSSNKPLKPFSRSAAKRESVMALGSIEHLQHYFTKSGIAAESDPLGKPNSGMVPIFGGLSSINSRASMQSLPDFDLPPSPAIPEIVQPAFSPFVKTYEVDPENLRPGVIDDLGSVEHAWSLRIGGSINSDKDDPFGSLTPLPPKSKPTKDRIDILDVLKTTTHAIRSVRNYLLSLPDDSATPLQRDFRFPAISSKPLPPRRTSSQPRSDPLSRIRRGALEVLTSLRALEESSRLPLSDEAYDAQSDHGEHASNAGSGSGSGSGGISRGTSPDFLDVDADTSISFVSVGGGLKSVPVWEDEDSFDVNNGQDEETKERWDERLVLGGGWLYKQDITKEALVKEREVVGRYLDVVDEALFGGTKDGVRGWERERVKMEKERRAKGRRVSAGEGRSASPSPSRGARRVVSANMLDAMKSMAVTEEPEPIDDDEYEESDSVDEDDLPRWAKRHEFLEDPLGRTHALLSALLPSTLSSLLPPSSVDRSSLLQALSSGQLLCAAYNTGVRRSRKPWGYVSKDAIHDIAALESQPVNGDSSEQREKTKRGWTFRRTDNLRLWAAALKLRYMLPVVTTNPSKASITPAGGRNTPRAVSTPLGTTPLSSPSPTKQKFPALDEVILFDAPVVARQEPGWEGMLEALILKWVEAVVDERRGDR